MGDRVELMNRTARPITLHFGWVFVLGGILFLGFAGYFVLAAMDRWARGEPVDWQGFGYILTAMGSAAGVIAPIIISILRDRRIQKVEEIRAGRAPEPRPFDPSPPSSPPLAAPSAPSEPNPHEGGGLINNHAIE